MARLIPATVYATWLTGVPRDSANPVADMLAVWSQAYRLSFVPGPRPSVM